MGTENEQNKVIVLAAGEGRTYKLGPMTAVFKADENETAGQYSISEWWIEPHSEGPGEHSHTDKDQVFYVLEGIVSVYINDKWIDAGKGAFIRISKTTIHAFANRTDNKAGFLNFDVPGGFEHDMPSMAEWFKENS